MTQPANAVRALAWLAGEADRFALRAGSADELELRLKSFTELVLMVTLLLRLGRFEVAPLSRLVAFARHEVRAFDWEALALFAPEASVSAALACELLAATGDDTRRLTAFLARFYGSGFGWAADRPAFRRLEKCYVLARLGVPVPREAFRRELDQTVLGADTDIAGYHRELLYAVTHTLFYATDFSFRSASWVMDEPHLRRAERWISAGMGASLRAGDLDLVGETMMCADLLELPRGAVYGLGLDALGRAQRDDGSVPGRAHPAPRLDKPAPADGHERWRRSYHTTLVFVLLHALRLARDARAGAAVAR